MRAKWDKYCAYTDGGVWSMTTDCLFAQPLAGAEAGVLAKAVEACTKGVQMFLEVPKQERGGSGSKRCFVYDTNQTKCGGALSTAPTTTAAATGPATDAGNGEGAATDTAAGQGQEVSSTGQGGAASNTGSNTGVGSNGVLHTCASAFERPCDTGNDCYKHKFKCDGGIPDCQDGSDESAEACREKNGDTSGTNAGGSSAAAASEEGEEGEGGEEGEEGEESDGGEDGKGGGDSIMPLVGAVVGGLALLVAGILYAYNTCKQRNVRKAMATGATSGDGSTDDATAGAANFNITVRNRVFDPMLADTRSDGDVDGELYTMGSSVVADDATYNLSHADVQGNATYDLGAPLPAATENTYDLGTPLPSAAQNAYDLEWPKDPNAYDLGAPKEPNAYDLGAPKEPNAYDLGAPKEPNAYDLGAAEPAAVPGRSVFVINDSDSDVEL